MFGHALTFSSRCISTVGSIAVTDELRSRPGSLENVGVHFDDVGADQRHRAAAADRDAQLHVGQAREQRRRRAASSRCRPP